MYFLLIQLCLALTVSPLLATEINVELEVLTKAMQLARHIGSRGREGHSVGALFAIGSLPNQENIPNSVGA